MLSCNFSRSFAIGLFALALACFGCSGPRIELETWRAEQAAVLSAETSATGALSTDLLSVGNLRNSQELAQARQLALKLVTAHPEAPDALMAASRAESDAVFLFAEKDKSRRNHAAASALDYALLAEQRGAVEAADRAQLAWALGTSTHLQPMFERSSHAKRTLETAESALEHDPDQATALATLALVNLRLESLPWIAKAMAWSRPDSSLTAAESFARRAAASVPSRENRQILAKVLIAAGKHAQARAELEAALAAPAVHPRDSVLEPALRQLLASLE